MQFNQIIYWIFLKVFTCRIPQLKPMQFQLYLTAFAIMEKAIHLRTNTDAIDPSNGRGERNAFVFVILENVIVNDFFLKWCNSFIQTVLTDISVNNIVTLLKLSACILLNAVHNKSAEE